MSDDATPMTAAELQYRRHEARRLMINGILRERGYYIEIGAITAEKQSQRYSPPITLQYFYHETH